MNQQPFKLGHYFPIYLWGGPGTIRMNRLKFMQVPVDEKIHNESHQLNGAAIIVNQMHQNWIHLTYSWGFSPEVEEEDWISFQQAAKIYHEHGTKVFAYIQSSNCVFEGSNKEKKWYALDPDGRKFHYYTRRYMTCMQNTEWVNFLKERIKGAIERNADGIFFDNLWYGTQPSGFAGSWLGSAGCYCEGCKQKYYLESGKTIPELMNLNDPDVLSYLEWRARQLTLFFKSLANYARSIKPDVVISANDYDVIMRPSKLIYGIEFYDYAEIQDLMMIENFCLPNWEPGKQIRFPNNAMTIRNARSILPSNKHLSVLSYDVGIGFDDVYPTRRILQSMAEITALGASVTTKGTEYFNGKEMTLITSPAYEDQQKGIGDFNFWLANNAHLFYERMNFAPVTVVNPGDALWKNWFQISPVYFGCMQTLTKAGIPWNVSNIDKIDNKTKVLLTFTEHDKKVISSNPENLLIHVPDLASWKLKPESFLSKHKFLHLPISTLVEGLIRAYHTHSFSRKIMDRLGMAKMITQTPLFYMPEEQRQLELLNVLPFQIFPRIVSNLPVLIDLWEMKNGMIQIHLVNYANKPQSITVHFGKEEHGEVIFPGDTKKEEIRNSDKFNFEIDNYAIIILAAQKESYETHT